MDPFRSKAKSKFYASAADTDGGGVTATEAATAATGKVVTHLSASGDAAALVTLSWTSGAAGKTWKMRFAAAFTLALTFPPGEIEADVNTAITLAVDDELHHDLSLPGRDAPRDVRVPDALRFVDADLPAVRPADRAPVQPRHQQALVEGDAEQGLGQRGEALRLHHRLAGAVDRDPAGDAIDPGHLGADRRGEHPSVVGRAMAPSQAKDLPGAGLRDRQAPAHLERGRQAVEGNRRRGQGGARSEEKRRGRRGEAGHGNRGPGALRD